MEAPLLEKNMKKHKKKKIFKLIFLMGFLVALYPLVTRLYYRTKVVEQVKDFDEAKAKLDKEEVDKRMRLARGYNEALRNQVPTDPYEKTQQEEGKKAYAKMLEVHERLGHVEIPDIDQDIPLYAGTSEAVLQKGSGHMEGTSLPIGGNSTHAVLTAHSGLPTARLFTDLKLLKVGDKFYVHNMKETLAYEVDQMKTVDPGNFEDLLIVPGHDYCTLLTCTPYMVNTHRLLVRGHRVKYVPAVEEKIIAERRSAYRYRVLFYVSLSVIAVLLVRLRKQKKKKKALEEAMRQTKGRDNA